MNVKPVTNQNSQRVWWPVGLPVTSHRGQICPLSFFSPKPKLQKSQKIPNHTILETSQLSAVLSKTLLFFRKYKSHITVRKCATTNVSAMRDLVAHWLRVLVWLLSCSNVRVHGFDEFALETHRFNRTASGYCRDEYANRIPNPECISLSTPRQRYRTQDKQCIS